MIEEEKLLPELRFPEFEGEWVKKKLSEVTSKIQDGTHFSPTINEKKDYKYITSKNIKNGVLDLSEVDYVSEEGHRKIYKRADVELGDVLLTKDGASTGNVCINTLTEEFSLLSSVAFLRADNTSCLNEFLFQLISSPLGQKEIFKSIAGQAITRITLTKLRNYKFAFPTLPEQTKIATFLTFIDRRIHLLENKKTDLEQYKKGVMQGLFRRPLSELGYKGLEDNRIEVQNEDNNNPKILKSNKSQFRQLRFKKEDGTDFPDWEEKKLGEVAEIQRGASPRPISDPKWFEQKSKVGWVRISDVTKSEKILLETEQYLSNKGIQKSRLIPKGNLIMSICATIGKPVYTGFDVCIHDGFVVFNNLKLHLDFAYYCLQNIERRWYRYGQPGIQLNLNTSIVKGERVNVPSLPEQQKIASFLSALDKKIEIVAEQIEVSKVFKIGLLQKMFV